MANSNNGDIFTPNEMNESNLVVHLLNIQTKK